MAKDGAAGCVVQQAVTTALSLTRSAAASSCHTVIFLVCSEKWIQKQLGLLVTLFWFSKGIPFF